MQKFRRWVGRGRTWGGSWRGRRTEKVSHGSRLSREFRIGGKGVITQQERGRGYGDDHGVRTGKEHKNFGEIEGWTDCGKWDWIGDIRKLMEGEANRPKEFRWVVEFGKRGGGTGNDPGYGRGRMTGKRG